VNSKGSRFRAPHGDPILDKAIEGQYQFPKRREGAQALASELDIEMPTFGYDGGLQQTRVRLAPLETDNSRALEATSFGPGCCRSGTVL